jgi:hypothetical protein
MTAWAYFLIGNGHFIIPSFFVIPIGVRNLVMTLYGTFLYYRKDKKTCRDPQKGPGGMDSRMFLTNRSAGW